MTTRASVAVIAAGGRGQRFGGSFGEIPKALLRVGGKRILTRQLELTRDELGIRDVCIVVGYGASSIVAEYGDGQALGLRIRYIDNPDVDHGLATVLTAVAPYIDEPFVLLLGDELYLSSNHAAFGGPADAIAVCAILPCRDRERICRNYTVALRGTAVERLVEKPREPLTPHAGCGTYLFTPEIFRFAPRAPFEGKLELTDVLDRAARKTGRVSAFELRGDYVNVNTPEDLEEANFLCRAHSSPASRISVVLPAWNEAHAIEGVIADFAPHADEIIVMDNLSADGTAERARACGARVFSVPLAGYGDALRQGMDRATGDVLVLVESDGTFRARDLGKLLEHLKTADMVIGTRTARHSIEDGANMHGALRMGNIAVAKLLEALWWSSGARLTDVGCTYRAIWRDAYERIRPRLSRTDATFAPEMLVEALRDGARVVEVPVTYARRRGGKSKHSANLRGSVRVGLSMVGMLLAKRYQRVR